MQTSLGLSQVHRPESEAMGLHFTCAHLVYLFASRRGASLPRFGFPPAASP